MLILFTFVLCKIHPEKVFGYVLVRKQASKQAIFLFATLITKNIGKEEEKKKKWRGDLTETIGAYERLGLLEL